jgi:hypothetical protein
VGEALDIGAGLVESIQTQLGRGLQRA